MEKSLELEKASCHSETIARLRESRKKCHQAAYEDAIRLLWLPESVRSRKKYQQIAYENGRAFGFRYAKNCADCKVLPLIKQLVDCGQRPIKREDLVTAITEDPQTDGKSVFGNDYESMSDPDFLQGFLVGAMQVWDVKGAPIRRDGYRFQADEYITDSDADFPSTLFDANIILDAPKVYESGFDAGSRYVERAEYKTLIRITQAIEDHWIANMEGNAPPAPHWPIRREDLVGAITGDTQIDGGDVFEGDYDSMDDPIFLEGFVDGVLVAWNDIREEVEELTELRPRTRPQQ